MLLEVFRIFLHCVAAEPDHAVEHGVKSDQSQSWEIMLSWNWDCGYEERYKSLLSPIPPPPFIPVRFFCFCQFDIFSPLFPASTPHVLIIDVWDYHVFWAKWNKRLERLRQPARLHPFKLEIAECKLVTRRVVNSGVWPWSCGIACSDFRAGLICKALSLGKTSSFRGDKRKGFWNTFSVNE